MLTYKWREISLPDGQHRALMLDTRNNNILLIVFQTKKGYFISPFFSAKGEQFEIRLSKIPSEIPKEILEKIEHSFAYFLVDNFTKPVQPYIIPNASFYFGTRQYLCNHNISVLTQKERYGIGYCLTCLVSHKNNPNFQNYPLTHILCSSYPFIDISAYPIFKFLDPYQQRNLLMHVYALTTRKHPGLKSETVVAYMDFYIRKKYGYVK